MHAPAPAPAPAPASLASRLSWGALAALLLAGGLLGACGGGSPPAPTCAGTATPLTLAAGRTWQAFGPADWGSACTVSVTAQSLAADERLALVLVNQASSAASASISLAGAVASAAAPPLAAVAPASLVAEADSPDLADLATGHDLVLALQRAALEDHLRAASGQAPAAQRLALSTAAGAVNCASVPAPPATRTFCVDRLDEKATDPRVYERRTGVLVKSTARGYFYLDQAQVAATAALLTTRPSLWDDLGDYLEGTATSAGSVNAGRVPTGRIMDALHENFGTETDYDGNCHVTFFLTNLNKYLTGTGVVTGYFDPNSLQPADTSTGCTGNGAAANKGSNGADMLYLQDPASFVAKSWTLTQAVDQQIPGTMAHELQHNVIANARCFLSASPSCSLLYQPTFHGDLWLNEGLSMASEDFAGFGMAAPAAFPRERQRVGQYLACANIPGTLCMRTAGLTIWPTDGFGDSFGHYGGAHAFTRWLFDQGAAGRLLPQGLADAAATARALVTSTQRSDLAVGAATGLPFEETFLRFGAAALFSGRSFSPVPDWEFAGGVPWSPLYTAVGQVSLTKLTVPGPVTSTVQAGGWAAYQTGFGKGGDATLTVTSSAAAMPQALLVRFKGTLLP